MLLDLNGYQLRPDIAFDEVRLDDICPGVTRTGSAFWEPNTVNVLNMPLSRDLTPAEKDRLMIRLCSPNDVVEARMVQAYQAIMSISNYLAIGAPTNAQVVAEVRLISQVTRELLREYLSDTSSS